MAEAKVFTLRPSLLQIASLNSFPGGVSTSRGDMFASEIGQAPPVQGAEVKLIQTGMEREYGKYTHQIKMPVNGVIQRVVNQYSANGTMGLRYQIPTTVIFQDMDFGGGSLRDKRPARFGVVHIPIYSLNHHVLGFDFVRTPAARSLQNGIAIPKDTVLARSPSIDSNGDYRYGKNANILLGSFPEVRQDGVVLRRGYTEASKFKGYGEMTIQFDGDEVPLNLYGDDKNYKIFPDIGEEVRSDGVVFATRRLIPGLYPIQLSRRALQQYMDTDDGKIAKEDNARVVSVEVIYAPKGKPTTPVGMDVQPRQYLERQRQYYQELRSAYDEIRQRHGSNFVLSPDFQNLLVRGEMNLIDHGRDRQRITFVESGSPLSEWTIKITYSYDITPTIGHKLADQNGGKGVVVDVWDDDRMPVDADGNVADIIMDGGSIVNRLNPSRTFEIDINASFARTRKTIIESIKMDGSRENYLKMFNWLLEAYDIVSPRFADIVRRVDPFKHIQAVLKDDIHLWIPTDNPRQPDLMIEELLSKYPKCFGPILITMDDGRKVWSENPGTIGKQYIIILEKTGEEYSAVSSPVLQHQGIPGKLTKADKQSSPGRPQATRITGETEGRLINSLAHHDALFKLLDIANSPTTHRAVCRQLLTHPTPTNIDQIVDREKYPRGGNRIVRIGNDGLFAAGFMFDYHKVEV